MKGAPKIEDVVPVEPYTLRVRFANGIVKEYDCRPLLERLAFRLLKNPAFFRIVQVDTGGYGVSWNSDIDLSEYELWTNGKEISSECFDPNESVHR
jgi:hypothetical protein